MKIVGIETFDCFFQKFTVKNVFINTEYFNVDYLKKKYCNKVLQSCEKLWKYFLSASCDFWI